MAGSRPQGRKQVSEVQWVHLLCVTYRDNYSAGNIDMQLSMAFDWVGDVLHINAYQAHHLTAAISKMQQSAGVNHFVDTFK